MFSLVEKFLEGVFYRASKFAVAAVIGVLVAKGLHVSPEIQTELTLAIAGALMAIAKGAREVGLPFLRKLPT